MIVNPGIRRFLGSAIQRLFNSASFYATLTHSLVPERGTGSPTFTRASTATFTDWEGVLRTVPSGCARFEGARMVRNLLTFTEDFSNAAWTKINGGAGSAPTVTSGFTDPDGGTTAWRLQANRGGAAAGDYSIVRQAHSSGNCRAIYVKSNTASTQEIYFGAANGPLDKVSATTSWTRVSNPNTANTLTDIGSYGATGNATQSIDVLIWHPQLEEVTGQADQTASEYVSVGVESAPYHGAGVDGVEFFSTDRDGAVIPAATNTGYLAEGARTNLCTYSQDMSNAAWSKLTAGSGSAPVCTQNYSVAPDGTTTATRVVLTRGSDASSGNYSILRSNNIASLANPHTSSFSVWMKTNDASTKTVGFYSSYAAGAHATVTGTWTRFTVDGVSIGQPIDSIDIFLRGTLGTSADADLSVWGAQIELGSSASTYIATTTAAVPRAADVDANPTASNILAAASTVYLEFTPDHTPSGTIALWGTYVDASNYTAILHDATNMIMRKRIAGVNYDATIANAFTSGTTYKMAASWGASGSTIYLNGVSGTPHANTTAAQIAATMQFGADGNSLQQPGAAVIKNYIWQRQLSGSEQAAITA